MHLANRWWGQSLQSSYKLDAVFVTLTRQAEPFDKHIPISSSDDLHMKELDVICTIYNTRNEWNTVQYHVTQNIKPNMGLHYECCGSSCFWIALHCTVVSFALSHTLHSVISFIFYWWMQTFYLKGWFRVQWLWKAEVKFCVYYHYCWPHKIIQLLSHEYLHKNVMQGVLKSETVGIIPSKFWKKIPSLSLFV